MILTVMIAAALQASALPGQAVVRDDSRSRPSAQAVSGTKAVSGSIARSAKNQHRVVIDAGHGGRDPGGPMRFGELYEKDIALQFASKLGATLKERGVHVIYTRTTDTLIARADRGRIANQAHGDIFISIHVNAANPNWRAPERARGFETYFLGVAKTEEARRVEEMEEESERFESKGASSAHDPLDFILNDMRQNEHLRESSELAELIQRHLREVHPGPDRGVKQAGFTVLVAAFMPSVLVELGFGTNRAEAEFLASPLRQYAMARSVADATIEYLQRYQRRVGGGPASGAHE